MAEIIHQSTSDLLGSLRNTLTYFMNSRQNDPIQAVILTGGAAQLPGLAQSLGDVTRLKVIPADPFATVDASKAVRKFDTIDPKSMTVALGLAIGGAS